jgi:hypothetical protein
MNVLAPAVMLDAPAVLGRDLDVVDVLVLDTLAARSGATPVHLTDFAGDASAVLSVSMTAAWAAQNPEDAEQVLLGVLAPRLVAQLVVGYGEHWRPEAEAVVDLTLASRLEELGSLPVAMLAGSTGVDAREPAELLAAVVQHPQAAWLV